jgi:RNA polymerase sigma-70 factor (ECF subfamily)
MGRDGAPMRFDELRESAAAKAWLYKIATNACLDLLKSRRRRRAQIEPAPDELFDVPDDAQKRPDAQASIHESVSLAFVSALQRLPPKQRAALLLVDVLGWRPRETAELLKTTEVSVNSLLQRARKNLDVPPAEPPSRHDDDEALRRYIAIWQSGNLDAFTKMLAHDAVVSMPPQPAWYTGHEPIRRFFAQALAAQRQYRFVPLRANGCPAVAVYTRRGAGEAYQAAGITVICLRAGLVTQVTRFVMPHLFARFGLPEQLPDEIDPVASS